MLGSLTPIQKVQFVYDLVRIAKDSEEGASADDGLAEQL